MDIFELKEILKEADYPYLGASEEMWINHEKKELYMADMTKGHIDNCYKMLIRQRPGIEHGACLIGIKNKMGKELDIDEQDNIKEMTIKLCDKKLKELERFL